jgi:hypothetical protein
VWTVTAEWLFLEILKNYYNEHTTDEKIPDSPFGHLQYTIEWAHTLARSFQPALLARHYPQYMALRNRFRVEGGQRNCLQPS